jgi:Flp pilus assembly protein CpaB
MPLAELRRLIDRLDGPAPTWPPALDAALERWVAAGPRVRLAVVVGAATVALVAAAAIAPARWGGAVTVVVATRDLDAGTVVTAADVTVDRLPARTVPPDALRTLDAAVGAGLRHPVAAGAPLLARSSASGGLAGLVAPGRVAVAVPVDLLPALAPGERVDLTGTDEVGAARVLAAGARVLRIDDATVWLEVERPAATAVTSAVSWGSVGVAVLGDAG